jgi:hypothetical protein
MNVKVGSVKLGERRKEFEKLKGRKESLKF